MTARWRNCDNSVTAASPSPTSAGAWQGAGIRRESPVWRCSRFVDVPPPARHQPRSISPRRSATDQPATVNHRMSSSNSNSLTAPAARPGPPPVSAAVTVHPGMHAVPRRRPVIPPTEWVLGSNWRTSWAGERPPDASGTTPRRGRCQAQFPLRASTTEQTTRPGRHVHRRGSTDSSGAFRRYWRWRCWRSATCSCACGWWTGGARSPAGDSGRRIGAASSCDSLASACGRRVNRRTTASWLPTIPIPWTTSSSRADSPWSSLPARVRKRLRQRTHSGGSSDIPCQRWRRSPIRWWWFSRKPAHPKTAQPPPSCPPGWPSHRPARLRPSRPALNTSPGTVNGSPTDRSRPFPTVGHPGGPCCSSPRSMPSWPMAAPSAKTAIARYGPAGSGKPC